VIAEHAIENNIDVQDVEYAKIKVDLEERGQILNLKQP
jgi:hypothetical protein